MFVADSQVQEIKQKADIVSVIDSRIKLVKSGRNLKAKCPFHGEKTPSFFVSPELQTFKCFGCGEGGDVLTFLQKYEGMDFPEALEYLAAKVGVTLKKGFRSSEELEKKRLEEILHLAGEYYSYLLTSHKVGRKALNYLKKRGITDRIIKTFGIGYSADSWDGLIKFLVGKKGYKREELEKVGLILKSGRGSGYYDRFRGRVMFPLKSMQGKSLGFSGRVLPGEGVDEKQAKYINSPETVLYHKSQMLFGLHEARKYIRKKDRVVVVEGELDMISSFKVGVREVVAIKGSALTREQVELIRKLTQNIILALDADVAGSEATKRGIEIADSMGMNLSVVEIVDGKDPDDLAQKDADKWKQLVEKAVSIYDFLIDLAIKTHDVSTGIGKKKASRELAPMINRISHLVEREHYLSVAAKAMGVSKRVFEEEVKKVSILGKAGDSKEVKKISKKAISRRERLERYVLGLFFQMSVGIKDQATKINKEWFSDLGLKRLWVKVNEVLIKEKKARKVGEIVESLPGEYQRQIQELFTSDVVGVDENKIEDLFIEVVGDLEKIVVREKLNKVNKELVKMSEKSDEKKKKKLQEEASRLKRRVKELDGR